MIKPLALVKLIKGCSACHSAPTLTEKGHIVCNHHPSNEKVAMYGDTLEESIDGWNNGDDWILLGANVDMVNTRPTYSIEQCK